MYGSHGPHPHVVSPGEVVAVKEAQHEPKLEWALQEPTGAKGDTQRYTLITCNPDVHTTKTATHSIERRQLARRETTRMQLLNGCSATCLRSPWLTDRVCDIACISLPPPCSLQLLLAKTLSSAAGCTGWCSTCRVRSTSTRDSPPCPIMDPRRQRASICVLGIQAKGQTNREATHNSALRRNEEREQPATCKGEWNLTRRCDHDIDGCWGRFFFVVLFLLCFSLEHDSSQRGEGGGR